MYKRQSIDDTPYGASEMRRRSKKDQIARQGRINKADQDMQEEAALNAVNKKAGKKKKGRKKKGGRGLRLSLIHI